MSTNLDNRTAPERTQPLAPDAPGAISEVFYETGYGHGLLVWRGGILVSHRLPARGNSGRSNREDAVVCVSPDSAADPRVEEPRPPAESRLISSLQSYFSGNPVDFDALNLPLDFSTYSEFELDVVKTLAAVSYGETISYGQLAARAGHPRAYRAAGSVMARNLYPLILPCHRIIKSNGRLGNFSGGAGWKQWLLRIEGLGTG